MNGTWKSKLKKEVVEYYTPDWVWKQLYEYIPKDKIIWEPFRKDTKESCRSADCLRELGFNVVNPLCDFFSNDYGEIIVSNPPFKFKKKSFKNYLISENLLCYYYQHLSYQLSIL